MDQLLHWGAKKIIGLKAAVAFLKQYISSNLSSLNVTKTLKTVNF